MIHNLKILPEYFSAVACGAKTFEVRKDDRQFDVGDVLKLQEYDREIYTGRAIDAIATYIMRDTCYCKEGFCIIGIKIINAGMIDLGGTNKEVNYGNNFRCFHERG